MIAWMQSLLAAILVMAFALGVWGGTSAMFQGFIWLIQYNPIIAVIITTAAYCSAVFYLWHNQFRKYPK